MIPNPVLIFSTFLSVLHVISAYENSPRLEGSYLLRTRKGDNKPDYIEYSDYDSKIQTHHPERGRWEISAEKNNGPLTQTLPGTQNYQHKPRKPPSKLKLIPNWPDPSKHLGQLSAVSIDANGNVVVFHRGDRTWNSQTFSYNNVYTERKLGPIQQNTVVVFNITSGDVIHEWGSNMFYLPHGLSIDSDNNVWVTDVALHQVFKFPANGGPSGRPLLSLGTPFVPGNDDNHFCKPTDVAILSNGDFFVSDGYCNSRIIKYDKFGRKLMQWGRSTINSLGRSISMKPPPDHFLVPHGLAVAEEKEMLFVADRENGRIQCFNTSSGVFMTQLHSYVIGPRIFSVAYAPVNGGMLYIINGPSMSNGRPVKVQGFVASLELPVKFVAYFDSDGEGMQNPHDVAVTKDGSQVFVVELNPFKVWKFVQGNVNVSSPVAPPKAQGLNGTNNVTNILQSPANLKLSTITRQEAKDSEQKPVEHASGSTAGAIVIIVTMILIIIAVVAVVIARIRRGCFSRYSAHRAQWDFHISSPKGFGLGQFLDRHQGFEKVSTEESDDESSGANASELMPPQNAQFA